MAGNEGWHQLLGVLAAGRAAAAASTATEGIYCPRDGVLLQPGRGGKLHCPFDGWQGTAAQAVAAGPGSNYYQSGYAGHF
jgi:hypothetical protein